MFNPVDYGEAYVLPRKTWGALSCTLHLSRGLFPDYSGKYIHFYDDLGAFKGATAL